MRPRTMVVGCALTATLALVALPGLAGSRAPHPIEPVPVGALQPRVDSADTEPVTIDVTGPDAPAAAEGAVTAEDVFIEPGKPLKTGAKHRPVVDQPDASSGKSRKPAK